MMALLQDLLEKDVHLSSKMRIPKENKLLWGLMGLIAHSGDPWYWLIFFGLLWYYGGEDWKAPMALLDISILGLGGVIFVLKYTFRRSRPPGEWGAIYRLTDPHSFPSGHAGRSAMLALMGVILGPPWLAALVLIHGPLVIFSRVMTGIHYLSDVVVGSIIGLLFGTFMLLSQPLWAELLPFLF